MISAATAATAVLTSLTLFFGWDVLTAGDMGALPDTLPVFLIPDIPLTFETVRIIFPHCVAVAIAGLLESLVTQNILDDLAGPRSNRDRECIGQGLASSATGFIGGMAVMKFRRDGAEVQVVGMNEASGTIVGKLALHDKPGATDGPNRRRALPGSGKQGEWNPTRNPIHPP